MTTRKLSLFWSYRPEKTENWLMAMAARGLHLKSFNRFTRMFSFQDGGPVETVFRLQLNTRGETLPDRLTEDGWEVAAEDGKWQILSNSSGSAKLFPPRNPLLKRMRTHAYLAFIVAIFQFSALFPLWIMSLLPEEIEGVGLTDPWRLVFYILAGGAAVTFPFTVWLFTEYRKFEKREMDMAVDRLEDGPEVRKFRLAWMYDPAGTRKWLEKLAEKGLELDEVYVAIFKFRKTEPKKIRYECAFEVKVEPSYYEIHKELGWKLKYVSDMTLLNYSIWAKEYEGGEEPQFFYNRDERKRAVRRAFFMNALMSVLLILLLGNSLLSGMHADLAFFFQPGVQGILNIALLALLLLWLWILLKIFLRYWQSMKELKDH